jgi:hypothetical protein
MAYFIFLKYLDSLEDFRKNPHVKIPPKSPCANFQSLDIFKNSILIRKNIFSRQPVGPKGRMGRQATGPIGPNVGPIGPNNNNNSNNNVNLEQLITT